MPPATQSSASAPVRAAGLVLTLVATAAGAAGATTLSPDAPPARPSAHDVATAESDAPAPAVATVSRVTYASPGPSFDPLLAEGRAQHERNARVAREAAAEQAAAAAEQAAAAQAAAEILAAQAEEDALSRCDVGRARQLRNRRRLAERRRLRGRTRDLRRHVEDVRRARVRDAARNTRRRNTRSSWRSALLETAWVVGDARTPSVGRTDLSPVHQKPGRAKPRSPNRVH